jgi:hypothetical protein
MKALNSILISLLLFWQFSCTQSDVITDISEEDTRVYLSNFDKKIDFSTYKTYSLLDTVYVVINDQIRQSMRPNTDKTFIQFFNENLQYKNFIKINRQNKPDLGIMISRVGNSKIGLGASYPVFYDNLWGYGTPKSSFKYPGYYTDYGIGSPIWNIEVVDLKNAIQNKELKIVWNAQIHGEGILEERNFGLMIDKIFEISTFLNEKP